MSLFVSCFLNIDINFCCSRFDIPGGIWIHLSSPVCLHAYTQIHYSMPFYCACTIPMWTRVPYFNFVNVTIVFRGKSYSETSTWSSQVNAKPISYERIWNLMWSYAAFLQVSKRRFICVCTHIIVFMYMFLHTMIMNLTVLVL